MKMSFLKKKKKKKNGIKYARKCLLSLEVYQTNITTIPKNNPSLNFC